MNVHIDVTSGTFDGNEVTAEQINEGLSTFNFSSITDFVIDHYEDNKMYVTMEGLGNRILEYEPEYCGTWNVINANSFSASLYWRESTSSSDKPDYITLNRDKTFKIEFNGNAYKVYGTYTITDGKLEFTPLKGGRVSDDDDELGSGDTFKSIFEIYECHFGKNFGALYYNKESRNNFVLLQKENAENDTYSAPAKNKDLVGRYVAMTKGGSTWVTYTYVFKSDNSYTAYKEYVTTSTNGLSYTLTVGGTYDVSDGSLSLKPDASKTEFVSNSTLENQPIPTEPSSVEVTYTVQSGDSTLKITDLNKLFYKF